MGVIRTECAIVQMRCDLLKNNSVNLWSVHCDDQRSRSYVFVRTARGYCRTRSLISCQTHSVLDVTFTDIPSKLLFTHQAALEMTLYNIRE